MTKTMEIKGMMCTHCEATVKKALEKLEGVTEAKVSHETGTAVVEMSADGVKEYIGNYDDYLEKKRLEEAGIEEEEFAGKTKTQIDKEKRKARLAKESEKALRAKLKASEEAIANTEQLIADLEEKMGDPETYKDNELAQRIAKEHREAQEKLDALYEEWEELSEAVAEL